jgi:hypothetical protein
MSEEALREFLRDFERFVEITGKNDGPELLARIQSLKAQNIARIAERNHYIQQVVQNNVLIQEDTPVDVAQEDLLKFIEC